LDIFLFLLILGYPVALVFCLDSGACLSPFG